MQLRDESTLVVRSIFQAPDIELSTRLHGSGLLNEGKIAGLQDCTYWSIELALPVPDLLRHQQALPQPSSIILALQVAEQEYNKPMPSHTPDMHTCSQKCFEFGHTQYQPTSKANGAGCIMVSISSP